MDSITLKKLSGGPRDCISTDGVLCTRPDQEAQKDIGAPHHCEMLRFSISANVTPEHAASSQVAGGQWQPGCGQLLHQCRTLQERAPAAPAAVLLLPTLNLIQNLQI